MKLPFSWLNDFVNIDGLSVEEIARQLTLAGLEVEEIRYVGWPMTEDAAQGMHSSIRHEFKTGGISWDKEKIVVAEIREVMPHPNADKLVLCNLSDTVLKILTIAQLIVESRDHAKRLRLAETLDEAIEMAK